MDPFTLKPIDKALLIESAHATNGKILTVEDHYLEGGIGEAVAGALSEESNIVVRRIAIGEVPRSGTPNDLLDLYGISRQKIVQKIRDWL